jgi:cystathionine gamma-synthase
VVIDDTVGSFCNIDILPYVDVLVTSLTKSFSGYADVMAGSAVLNPAGPCYQSLSQAFQETFHNGFYAGDAAQLLSNSNDYLARSVILNRNASAIATLLQAEIGKPNSPVSQVIYPSTVDTRANYESVMRSPSADFTPGYGCLLSVEFEDKDLARAFYDNLDVHHGPHLGAHLTLALPFNELVWGKDPKEFEEHIAYGLRGEQIRISVGLEDEAELLDVVRAALAVAGEEKRKRGETKGEA